MGDIYVNLSYILPNAISDDRGWWVLELPGVEVLLSFTYESLAGHEAHYSPPYEIIINSYHFKWWEKYLFEDFK